MSSEPPTYSWDVGGTFGYMAPELFSEIARPSKEVDMYAFGMVVYEVITGTRPFGRRRMAELPLLTARGIRPGRPEDPVAIEFGQGRWEFAEQCWDENPERRPTAREALEHFERVAKTSIVVDPTPVIPACGAASEVPSRLSGVYKSFCECCGPSTTSPL